MTDMHHNLLEEPIFSVRDHAGRPQTWSLPQILAALCERDIESFEALQPHQRQPWHSLLVQLAAMAMARHDLTELPTDPDHWRTLLLALADGEPAAWHLVVPDLSKPAFLQPPVPEGSLKKAKYRLDITTPDDLDILILAKNHDIKQSRLIHPALEHWIYALITLQTMQGFLGVGNYGIARMNGGFGSRPLLGMTPGISWGERFRRDLHVLQSARPALIDGPYTHDGVALLWMLPWDGSKESALSLSACDPYFIEICRRIRFARTDGQLECWRGNTKDYRIAGLKDLSGMTLDPWTPVVRDKNAAKSLTVSENGFDYQMLYKILFAEDYEQPQSIQVGGIKGAGYLVATCFVRGQGQTGGFHHRIVPIPARTMSLFGRADSREQLARRARARMTTAGITRKNILYPAVCVLLQAGGNANIEFSDVATWMNAYEAAVDDIFFDDLWHSVDLSEEDAQRAWEATLYEVAHSRLQAAIDSSPFPSIRRWRAISDAESRFEAAARKFLTAHFPPRKFAPHTDPQEA